MSQILHSLAMDGIGAQRSDRVAFFLASVSVPAIAAAIVAVGTITPGSGFTQLPNIAPSGGTLTAGVSPADPAVVRATSLKLISATVNAPGSGVAISDTFNLGGTLCPAGPGGNGTTTAGVAAKVTVTHCQAVSAAVVAGGTGGTPGAVTLTGTTGTGTKFQATGVINASGVLTGALAVSVVGDYTVNPTTLSAEPVTGGGLTGATVAVAMGALTVTVATAGGVSVPPVNGAATTNVVGSGTGVTFNGLWGLGTVAIDHSGNYSSAPSWTVTPVDGNGTSASIAAGTLGSGGGQAVNRQIILEGIPDPTSAFVDGNAWASMDCVVQVAYASKQSNVSRPSLTVAIQPRLAANGVAAGAVSVFVIA